MALRYKTRKRLAILVLLVAMPAYVVAVVTVLNLLFPDPLDKPSLWVELAIYVGLGILWVLPLKPLFKGIGQPDPDGTGDGDER